MATLYIADVLVHPGKSSKDDPHKVVEVIKEDELPEPPKDDKRAAKVIEEMLKGKHFSMLAWRVHKVTTSERQVVKKKPTRVVSLIEETKDEIIRDFTPREARKWRLHEFMNYKQPTS